MTVSLRTGQSFLPVTGTVEESGQENAPLLVRATRKRIHLLFIIATVLIKTCIVLRLPDKKQAMFVILAEMSLSCFGYCWWGEKKNPTPQENKLLPYVSDS